MIERYIKQDHTATIVEVEKYGIINLEDLPIRIRKDQKGLYHIGWVGTTNDDRTTSLVLSEHGGQSNMDFGGSFLGVIREIE